jgi:hypothetical protein
MLQIFMYDQHNGQVFCYVLHIPFLYIFKKKNIDEKQHRGLPLVFSFNKYSFTKCHLGVSSNWILSDVRERVLYDNT